MTLNTVAKLHYESIVEATREFFVKAGFETALIGISGGVDSAVVACIAADALGAENVYGIAMPSKNSSGHSVNDAKTLMKNLGANLRIIPIEEYHALFQESLGLTGIADENIQARIRGMILMSVSNMENHLVLATGNRSEALVGYCTMYGDTVGAFAPLANNFKTGVYSLAHYRNTLANSPIPENILTKPASAELAPGQEDEKELAPYEVLDEFLASYEGGASTDFLYEVFGFELTQKITQLIKKSAWKREQCAPGPNLPNLSSPNRINVQRS